MKSLYKLLRFVLVVLVAFALPATAGATLKKEGVWPAEEKKVSLDFDGKPSEGLQELAKSAGWSLVVAKGTEIDSHEVHIDVDDQPADAVLEALFAQSNVVATRNGTLITVIPAGLAATAPAQPVAPVAPAAPAVPVVPTTPDLPPPAAMPTARGEDKNVVGGSLHIGKNEIVHTVTVTGGRATIDGTVTGDLAVAGGSAKLHKGARVVGNVTVMGGSVKIEKGARVDGHVAAMGGSVKSEDGAVIGGSVVDDHHKGNVKVSIDDDGDVHTSVDGVDHSSPGGRIQSAAQSFGRKVTAMSLLFVFGCVLLALMTGRMERLRVETAARPMRSFALGLLGSILGGIAAVIAVVILCITVVGIPIAVFGILTAVFAVYGAIAAVLTTIGAAIIGHKTKNEYVHLLIGCGAFLIASSLPFLGGLVTFAVAMIAIGTLVSTKAAGFLVKKRPAPPAMGLV
jgi:hypothetical protein